MPLFKSDLNSDRGICNSVSHKGFTRNKHPEKLYLYTRHYTGMLMQTQNYWSFKSTSFISILHHLAL